MNRREFVRLGALLGLSTGVGVLAACAPSAPAQPTAAPAGPPATAAPAAKPTTPPVAAATTAPPAPKPTTAPAQVAAPTAQPAAAAAAPSGTLTIAQGVDAESLDPYVTTSGASKGMLWTVFDRLVYRDLDLQIRPGLALSWRTLDENTWELQLRQGVRFHNGEEFDADSVKQSFAR